MAQELAVRSGRKALVKGEVSCWTGWAAADLLPRGTGGRSFPSPELLPCGLSDLELLMVICRGENGPPREASVVPVGQMPVSIMFMC